MRNLYVVVALAVASVTGCQRHSTMGWRFEVGRPATVSFPMPIREHTGELEATPISVQAQRVMPRAVDVRYCPPNTVNVPHTKDVGTKATAECP